MRIRLLADIGEYHTGDSIDVTELWADVMVAFGYAEHVLSEAIVTVHEDGHRVLELTMIDSLALQDRGG